METDTRYRLEDQRTRPEGRASSFITGALAFATGAILIVLGVMFSLILVAVIALVALLVFGYVWWKTRDLRRQLRERPPGGRVIEGEVIRDRE